MKKIKDLIECSYDIDIFGIAEDSRNVNKGFLYVATKGYYVDHFDYINDAINNGAVCIIADRNVEVSVPIIIVNNINDCYVELCQKFYDVCPNEFSFIGITGTDGKTTTTTIVHQILNGVVKNACIGTNGVLLGNEKFSTNNTTPCVFELFKNFNIAKNYGCKDIVMEVSSEALLHGRVRNIKYDIVALTNITEDHLNVHKTFEEYRNCKFKLLDLVKDDGFIIVNGDDSNCKMIDRDNLYTVGMNNDNNFVICDVNEMSKNVKFTIVYKNKKYCIISPLLGLYNVYNVSMAFAICLLKGVSIDYLVPAISKLDVVSGRREYLYFGQDYDIILDYAHTYNGVKCILNSVCNYKKIITVTGAAGGRDKKKRSQIGNFILEKSNLVIFTMDDPRHENVDDIIDQMVGKSKKKYLRIIDRRDAIYKALDEADKETVVLILGKGRDNYMAIGDKKVPYCDYDVVSEYFNG